MNTRKLILVIAVPLICATGCRGPNEPVPLRAPGLTAPRIGSAAPISRDIAIQFQIHQGGHVSMWVTRGIGPGEEEIIQVNHSMGYFFHAGGLSVRTLIDENLESGNYHVVWDTRDDRGVLVPEGYYRVYLHATTYLVWLDLAIVRN